MSTAVDTKSYGGAREVEGALDQVENTHDVDLDEKAGIADYKADAVEAENVEHNMGVLEAVRAYPMASFWAFVMSFTIVGCRSLLTPFHFYFVSSDEEWQLTPSLDYGVV